MKIKDFCAANSEKAEWASICYTYAKSLQLCPTLLDSMDYSSPGSCPWDSPGKNTGLDLYIYIYICMYIYVYI